ncbi:MULTISPECIES: hypothetical protein [unclassified Rhizobium]
MQSQIAGLEERKAAPEATLSILHGKLNCINAGKPDDARRDYQC